MKERLKRILLIAVIALIIVGLVKVVAGWQGEIEITGGSTNLSEVPMKEKLEDLGGDILGKAVEILPGAPSETKEEETTQETEPIEEPVKNVEEQTQTLIEAIKKLPEDQVEAIKKQLYKEFCEGVLIEE